MVKKVNINRWRVNIVTLLLIATLLSITSCNYCNSKASEFSHSTLYNCDDTLSQFNLSVYARISHRYNHSSLPVIIIITTPSGERYSDTLNFPVTERGVEARKVQSGIWQDYEWSYRRAIIFNNRGRWIFTVKQDSLSRMLDGVGQMGVKVYKSKSR